MISHMLLTYLRVELEWGNLGTIIGLARVLLRKALEYGFNELPSFQLERSYFLNELNFSIGDLVLSSFFVYKI